MNQPGLPRRRGPAGSALALALGLSLGLLAGCATPPPSSPEQAYWSGRLALRVDGEPPQSFSAGFELHGDASRGELQLLTPLGGTAALARWSPQGAELDDGQQTRRYASMDELTRELAGAELPLAALFDWLRGAATVPAGWRVDLSGQAEGHILARRESPPPRAELRLRVQP